MTYLFLPTHFGIHTNIELRIAANRLTDYDRQTYTQADRVGMHLKKIIYPWFQNYLEKKNTLPWTVFEVDILKDFLEIVLTLNLTLTTPWILLCTFLLKSFWWAIYNFCVEISRGKFKCNNEWHFDTIKKYLHLVFYRQFLVERPFQRWIRLDSNLWKNSPITWQSPMLLMSGRKGWEHYWRCYVKFWRHYTNK